MKFRSYALSVILAAASIASAQVVPLASSHAPTVRKEAPTAKGATSAKPAIRVNDAVLTETDLLREMYVIFPYAQQHNGFPKDMEPQIRKGATDMIIFEELLYQEAKRRNLTVPAEKVTKAVAQLKEQFPSKALFDQYLASECKGSRDVLREKVRRSFLIERMLKSEVDSKAVVTEAAARAYYDANPKQFEHAATVSIQTISIIPPDTATQAQKEEAKKKIFSAVKFAKEAKTSRDFGLIAEQISEDDWHTKLGDRGQMELAKLPPNVIAGIKNLKAGQVSDPIAVGTAWVIVRLNEHAPAGKTSFAQAKTELIATLQKQKMLEIRAALNKKLRQNAKIEVL